MVKQTSAHKNCRTKIARHFRWIVIAATSIVNMGTISLGNDLFPVQTYFEYMGQQYFLKEYLATLVFSKIVEAKVSIFHCMHNKTFCSYDQIFLNTDDAILFLISLELPKDDTNFEFLRQRTTL